MSATGGWTLSGNAVVLHPACKACRKLCNSACCHGGLPVCVLESGAAASVRTQQGVLQGAVDGQDVLVDQLDGTRSVGDLVVEVVGQTRSLQLQLLGLQGRLGGGLCWESNTEGSSFSAQT